MQSANPLGEAPVKSLFFKYYFPALTSILSTTVHQVLNGVILGGRVGKEGIAAVGLYGSVMLVLIAFTLPVMIGGGILISKYIGAGHFSKVQLVFNFATSLALVLGSVLIIATPLLINPLSHFLAGEKSDVLARSLSDYMFWQFLGMPFFFLRMFWGNFISNDNGPGTSRNASLIAVLLNILFDILLIIIFPLGVTGASIATSVAFLGATIYLFCYNNKGKGHFNFRDFNFTLRFFEWKPLLNLGLPSFVSEISFSAGLLLLNRAVIAYGVSSVSAFGMVNYISFIFLRLFTAAMIASLPVMAFNIGAGMDHRVLQTLRFGLSFTFLLGIAVTALGFLVPDFLIWGFSDNEPQEFKQIAAHAISLYFLLFLAAGPNYVLGAYFQSIGKSGISIAINVLKGFAFIALFLVVLPDTMGQDRVWLSRGLSEVLTLSLAGVYWATTRNSRAS